MTDTEQLSLGAVLKKQREDLHLSVQDIADKTRICLPFLQAMEDDRFDDFPGDTYLCGFLKNVAETLGLDAQSIIEHFRLQTGTPVGGHEKRAPDYAVPEHSLRKTGHFASLLWPALLLLVGLILGGVYWWNDRQVAPLSFVFGESALSAGGTAVESLLSAAAVETNVPPMPPKEYLISAIGSVLRVEALEGVQIEVRIDELPLKTYTLVKDAVFSWQVTQSASLQAGKPAVLRVWLDDQPLDLQGRSELQLRSAQSLAPAEH
jgi:cytoskeleton protein RodZ